MPMKNLHLLTATVLLCIQVAIAQETPATKKIGFGLKAGVNFARMQYTGEGAAAYTENAKNNIGYNTMLHVDFPLTERIDLQTGLSLQNKGSKTRIEIGGQQADRKDSFTVLEIPVNAIFKLPTANVGTFMVNIGPYIAFNLAGKTDIKFAEQNAVVTKMNLGTDATDNFSKIDYGGNIGLAYRLRSGLSFGTNYSIGLASLQPTNNSNTTFKPTNRILSLHVGYAF